MASTIHVCVAYSILTLNLAVRSEWPRRFMCLSFGGCMPRCFLRTAGLKGTCGLHVAELLSYVPGGPHPAREVNARV